MEGQEVVDAAHLGLGADRAEAVIDALVLEEGIQIRDVGLLGLWQSEQSATENELVFALAVDEEAVVAHTAELRRGDMGEEAADEFIGRQAHGLFNRRFFLPVVEVGEGHLFILDALNTMVGDGDAVDVTAQIADQVPRLGEGVFGVDDPTVGTQLAKEALPTGIGGQRLLSMQIELALVLYRLQGVDEFLAEDR